jgi:hypothetical protein
MLTAFRKVALAVLAGGALVAAGCGSNNKGKIEGKWKITGGTDMPPDQMKKLEDAKVFAYLEFNPDGSAGFSFESTDEALQKVIQAGAGGKTSFAFKYRLGAGDNVELTDVPKELQDKQGGSPFGAGPLARFVVKIDGQNMTFIGDDKKSFQLVRTK